MSSQRRQIKNNEEIGILGGTFNPIHVGHIEMAKQAHIQFGLNKILVMPSGDPSSYKNGSVVIDSKHRCNMIKLAIKPFPYMELSTTEVERKGLTYTADTLEQLYPLFEKIYFIIGADSLFGLPKWHNCQYVMSHCTLLVADRNEYNHNELNNQKDMLSDKYGAKIEFIDMEEIPVSSTKIRSCMLKNISITGMVPENVEKYISDNRLYR